MHSPSTTDEIFKKKAADVIEKTSGTEVSYEYLRKLGVERGVIDAGIKEFLDGVSEEWSCTISTENGIRFKLQDLPRAIGKKIGDLTEPNPNHVNRNNDPLLSGREILEIWEEYETNYADYLFHYKSITSKKRRTELARKHAIFLICIRIFLEAGGKKGTILRIYNSLRKIDIVFYRNYESFRRKFKSACKSDQLEEEILHSFYLDPSKCPVPRKITEWHEHRIRDLYSKGYLITSIQETLNKEALRLGLYEISYSSVCRILTRTTRNISLESRYGYEVYDRCLRPYILNKNQKHKLQVVEIDGSRFQIAYLDSSNKVRFLKVFIILDVCSSLVVGYSFHEEETIEMVLSAFHMAFTLYGHMPACIICDNASSVNKKNKRFKDFTDTANLWFKTITRRHQPGRPAGKAHVENFMRNFPIMICRKEWDYVGLSFSAKSDDHRISKRKLEEIKRNKHKLRTKSGAILLGGRLLEQWNSKITKEKSPIQKFNAAKIKDAKPINHEQVARLCWEKVERKIENCKITLNSKEFEVSENPLRVKWNGAIVDVFYHPKQPKHVYLYQGIEFICKAKLKPHLSENDPTRFARIKHNESLRSYCKSSLNKNKQSLAMDDPMINVFYETQKETSNANAEAFINEYVLNDAPNHITQEDLDDENSAYLNLNEL